jgi:hypothetical protein
MANIKEYQNMTSTCNDDSGCGAAYGYYGTLVILKDACGDNITKRGGIYTVSIQDLTKIGE